MVRTIEHGQEPHHAPTDRAIEDSSITYEFSRCLNHSWTGYQASPTNCMDGSGYRVSITLEQAEPMHALAGNVDGTSRAVVRITMGLRGWRESPQDAQTSSARTSRRFHPSAPQPFVFGAGVWIFANGLRVRINHFDGIVDFILNETQPSTKALAGHLLGSTRATPKGDSPVARLVGGVHGGVCGQAPGFHTRSKNQTPSGSQRTASSPGPIRRRLG